MQLTDLGAYNHPISGIEILETHISWVLLADDFAYKIKKPVSLPFVDFSSLAAHPAYCEDELQLNRRLAPQVYLDVVPITGHSENPAIGGQGEALEYAVRAGCRIRPANRVRHADPDANRYARRTHRRFPRQRTDPQTRIRNSANRTKYCSRHWIIFWR